VPRKGAFVQRCTHKDRNQPPSGVGLAVRLLTQSRLNQSERRRSLARDGGREPEMVRKDRASQEDPDGGRATTCVETCRSRSEARG
jgi:hypothetical protein